MKKFLMIALILVTAGCAREEAGPVRYDRMELIKRPARSGMTGWS